MKKCREMTPDIFRNNLLSALAEMDIGSYEPLFRIIRVEKKDVCSDNYGDVFDMIVAVQHVESVGNCYHLMMSFIYYLA